MLFTRRSIHLFIDETSKIPFFCPIFIELCPLPNGTFTLRLRRAVIGAPAAGNSQAVEFKQDQLSLV